jgi:long-chain acyl-CoA synthetase
VRIADDGKSFQHAGLEGAIRPDPIIQEVVVVATANVGVSKTEAIRKWRVLPRELTEADDEISASMKVRRKVVLEHFADVFDEMYATQRR